MRSSSLLVLATLTLAAAAGTFVLARRLTPASPVLRGIIIGERALPDEISAADWLAWRRDTALGRRVRLIHRDQLFEITLGEAGVSIDVADTLERASRASRDGDLWSRVRTADRARHGKIALPLTWTFDEAKARAQLTSLAPAIHRAPVSARLDLDRHLKIADIPGEELDVESSLDALRDGAHDDDEAVVLATRQVSAAVTLGDLSRVDVTRVVSAYETTFDVGGASAGRAANIRIAASRFDGTVLAPGALFSFNAAVGPRTRARGFRKAPEILGDELTDGYGGGTCQASSTLHAAALFGALTVVERRSHSRVSSYTPLGLDAAVVYPHADLKIQNALPYPVMIHAYLPRRTALRVEILGGDPVAKVDYAFDVRHAEDFVRRITVQPSLPGGKRWLRRQKGTQGYDVVSLLKLRYLNGREDEREYESEYRATPEVYWVTPDAAPADLPPLPEHALGLEGEVETAKPPPAADDAG